MTKPPPCDWNARRPKVHKKIATPHSQGENRSLLCTAEREEANERLFRQIEENKKGAVSREEWLRMRKKSDEA